MIGTTKGGRALVRCTAGALLAMAAGAAGAQSAAATVVDVQPGDTFSAIAARYSGSAASWRKLYRPDASNLANPNRIVPGMRFELLSDAEGPYLRQVGGGGTATAAATRAAAPPVAAPAPQATQPPVAAVTPPPVPAPAPQPATARGEETLVIGVLPNISAATLSAQYERMKRYLEKTEGRKVQIVVPPSFKAFFDNTMKGDYDIAIAAPHFARVAQVDRKMIPLVTYEPRINALLVAPSESTVAAPKDLRERVVGFANPTSLVAMYGQQWLRQGGLEAGRDYEVKPARTDLGVGRMLLTGEAAAAIMSNGEFRALPAEESARMKVVEVIARVPNFVFMAHPRIDRDRLARLRTDLKAFLADRDDGDAFAKATGFSSIVDADDSLLRELEPFSAPTRRAMGVTAN